MKESAKNDEIGICYGIRAMARRKSGFDDFLTMAAKLPWQAAVVLAVLSFVGLHLLADGFATPAKVSSVVNLGFVAIRSGIRTFAYLLQFVAPPGFLIGAVVSWIKRKKGGGRFGGSETGPNIATSVAGIESLVCPRCGAQMIERTAKRGNSVGQKFWGCSSGAFIFPILSRRTEPSHRWQVVECDFRSIGRARALAT